MTIRKVKSSSKMFVSDPKKLRSIVLSTMDKISQIVGSSLGPSGKNCLIEADYPGLPNKNTKDGVTIFQSLGSDNSYEHIIIEQTRDAAQRTATEAGDGTTSATILSAAMVRALYECCDRNPHLSPQKIAREMAKTVREKLVPYARSRATKIEIDKNLHLLHMVAKISANGDADMADAVIKAFDMLGYGEGSHITIKTSSGPYGYEVGLIEGFPIPIGYEESCGKFHLQFVNDQANQRVFLEKPKFILFDGHISDIVQFASLFERLGEKYLEGDQDYRNVVLFAHGFSSQVLTNLAINFINPDTIKVLPIVTPRAGFLNSETHFLADLAAFTGAKVFGLKDSIAAAELSDLGSGAESIETYRFRTTIVGNPDELNIQSRAEELEAQKKVAESKSETLWLEERIGKLTSGIARLTILGGSNGELKEAHDRCEDAVCSVRSAIAKGVLPGGCRIMLDMIELIANDSTVPFYVSEILTEALYAPILRLLDNAGYDAASIESKIERLEQNKDEVFNVETAEFGSAEELGVFDSLPALEEAIKNATSIATVMGTLGGIIAYPRDPVAEREEASADSEFKRVADNPEVFTNEANSRV